MNKLILLISMMLAINTVQASDSSTSNKDKSKSTSVFNFKDKDVKTAIHNNNMNLLASSLMSQYGKACKMPSSSKKYKRKTHNLNEVLHTVQKALAIYNNKYDLFKKDDQKVKFYQEELSNIKGYSCP